MIPKHILEWLEEMRRHGTTVRTAGGSNLNLTRRDFEAYMLVEVDGIRLLTALENNHHEAERLRLIGYYRGADGIRFTVSDWKKLVTFLRGV